VSRLLAGQETRQDFDRPTLSGLHGYTHEFVNTLSETQQRDVLKKSIDVLTSFTGKKPRGWTAPAWATSKETVKLLEEFGVDYDRTFCFPCLR
jgi:peptidoglycan/xylan/chitin deacetylase (PgdA/CDA1 family)